MQTTEINENDDLGVISESMTNVVSKDKLRIIQRQTLRRAAQFISSTYGPMGSNTKIITGNDPQNISSRYSKDGLTVLKNIVFQDPIEASILEELIEISRHVEGKVGDGTTSTVILSSYIFNRLSAVQNEYNLQPHYLMQKFNKIVKLIEDDILEHGHECTVDDIYDIAMISTNGNVEQSENIKSIYDQYGMDVDLSVNISNDSDSKLKVYDGITITEGMSDPAFTNNFENNSCEIPNARVYYFSDPIDTAGMITYLSCIIQRNISDKIADDEEPIPTVICCPRISRDAEYVLKKLVEDLYAFQSAEMDKPPICIVTDIVASDETIMEDIANLCGCKKIKKYIDKKIYERDVEEGLAPTADNIETFYGECELVVADAKKTKFINPAHMYERNEDGSYKLDENGEKIPDNIYTAMVKFLEAEIENSKSTESAAHNGLLRKRLAALKSNMVDYLVGGITISEREAKKDLIEDAVKNCRSAAENGVGYAANFEGLRSSLNVLNTITDSDEYSDIEKSIAQAIFDSYRAATYLLYTTVYDNDEAEEVTEASLKEMHPFNIRTEDDGKVLCTIRLDIEVLETVSRIISMMVTCNQCLLQAPQLNKY